MLNETQKKGLITELDCQSFFTSLGYNVSVPIAQDCRYDMIVDIEHQLYKIQIKTSRPNTTQSAGLIFNTVSSRMNHTEGNIKTKYSEEDVDFFATSFEGQIYLLPIECCQGTEKKLVKTQAVQSNQPMDLMEDYEGEKVIQRIIAKEPLVKKHFIVAQYDLEDNYIASFESYMAAARSVGVTSTAGSSHIGEVVKGKRKTAYGFKWKKIEEK